MTAAVLPAPGTGLVRAWRGSWVPLTLLAVIVLGVVLGGLVFATPPKSNAYLDPADGTPDGAKGLAQILADRGYHLDEVYSPARALAAIGSTGGATLVITSPSLLTAGQRQQLAQARADLVLIGPARLRCACSLPWCTWRTRKRRSPGPPNLPARWPAPGWPGP